MQPIRCLCLLLLTLAASQARGELLATSGFNDATGALSDPEAGSPFTLPMTLPGQGSAEPGWAGPWQRLNAVGGNAFVRPGVVYEGDGAASVWADRGQSATIGRSWEKQADKVRVDAYIQVRPSARLAGQIGNDLATVPLENRQAAAWLIAENGSISVFDAALGEELLTPFSTAPNVWNKYTLFADARTQLWEFAFNDQKFRRARPLHFLNDIDTLTTVSIESLNSVTAYLDLVTVTAIEPMTGDVDGNGQLDATDIQEITTVLRLGRDDPGYDVDGDGHLTSGDRDVWVRERRGTWFGDANLDGLFDSGDLIAVFQAGQYEDAIPLNSQWTTGDWDGDGDFGTGDLIVAFQDGGYELGPRPQPLPVPEPRALLWQGLLWLWWARCRRG